MELTILSHSSKNNKNNKKNKNPQLNFLRESYLVSGIKLTRVMAKLGDNFDN